MVRDLAVVVIVAGKDSDRVRSRQEESRSCVVELGLEVFCGNV